MIDILSGGRVVCGFVRGLGQESMATNVNPMYNRERFDEAHNVIIAAWTRPGPFRWEGRHFDYRIVNPWMQPLQEPHPPIWIPGVVSPESVRWAAEHRYPYVALAPPLDATFTGSWRDDGTFSGGWRPNPGADETVNFPYDIGGHRL